jgi:hypothetical protein
MATLILSVVYPLAFRLSFPFAVSEAIPSPTQFFRAMRGRS